MAEINSVQKFLPINLDNLALALQSNNASPPIFAEAHPGSVSGVNFVAPLNAQMVVHASTSGNNAATTSSNSSTPTYPYGTLAPTNVVLPTNFSWTDFKQVQQLKPEFKINPIQPVRNQFACGSCWAVSAATCLSDRWAIVTKQRNPILSSTYLLSCSGMPQCDGGFPVLAAQFLARVGTVTLDCWSYNWCESNTSCTAGTADSTELNILLPHCSTWRTQCVICNENSCFPVHTEFEFYRAIESTIRILLTAQDIQYDIFAFGPIVSTFRVFADLFASQLPKQKLVQPDQWSKTNNIYINIPGQDIYGHGQINVEGKKTLVSDYFLGNHAIVIVGWGVDTTVPNFLLSSVQKNNETKQPFLSIPYWIIRNSWGEEWNRQVDKPNEQGYFRCAFSNPTFNINMNLGLDTVITEQGVTFGGATSFQADPAIFQVPTINSVPIMPSNNCSSLVWTIGTIAFLLFLFILILIWFQ